MKKRVHVLALVILAMAAIVEAAELTAVRAATAPRIDGVLEEVWKPALAAGSFVQVEPAFSAAATVRTDVYLMYDDEYLYVGARAHQSRSSVRGSSARRDSVAIWDGDYVCFAVDPQASGNAAYFFVVNPANSTIDGILDTSGNWTREWDGRIASAASIDDAGWSAEVAIPLAAIGFRSVNGRGFGFLATRYFAEKQEKSVNQIGDANAVFRIDRFARVNGVGEARSHASASLVPYGFAKWQSGSSNSAATEKGGADLRYLPIPSVTVLATVNPDFAQIESDEQIINVSDVPTAYPEKRPFFTESADLYPGLAVNSRNIGTIRAGVKLRQVLPTLRYDVTTVVDDQRNRWALGDVRWTDNHSYHVEVIGGVKDAPQRRDYNVTTNLRTWFLDRRLTAYTWFGTINGHQGRGNEWESVNSVRWDTRRFRAGLWNHIKSDLYNPNIVGFDTLSNETIVKGWLSWSYYSDTRRLREMTPEIDVERFDLFSSPGNDYFRITATTAAAVRPNDLLGVWHAQVFYVPATRQLFRFRRAEAVPQLARHRDAYGAFALLEQRQPGFSFVLNSDASKTLALKLAHEQGAVRGGRSRETSLDGSWKIAPSSTVAIGIDTLILGASKYQASMKETIARLRIEHTFPHDVNVRALYQANNTDAESRTRLPTLNLVVSWPYDVRTTLYLVLNDSRQQIDGAPLPGNAGDSRNVALKVSHALSF